MRNASITRRCVATGGALALVLLGYGVIHAAATSQNQAAANNQTTPGEFVVIPPTLVSLGFDWTIAGDDNRTAHVEVTYRKKGEYERAILPRSTASWTPDPTTV